MKDHIRTKSTVKLPSMYLDSKLFHRPCRDDRDTSNIGGHNKGIPDPQFEALEPDEEELSATQKAIRILKATPDTTGRLEGKFKVSVREMIRQLNRIVSAEYSQWMRWYHYSIVMHGHCRNVLAEEFSKHAGEELGHAEIVALRIVGLGGYPATDMDHPLPLQDTEEILKELLLREQKGMQLYREVLALCGDNEGTRQLLEGNVAQEQDHIDELWRFINNPEMIKAGAAQESGESWMPQPSKQRKREYDSSFHRDAQPGISGGASPDLPERGRDWHGTVPGVPDEPGAHGSKIDDELDRPPANLVDDKPDAKTVLGEKNAEAKKALAAAPRFSPGPFVSPPERDFLRTKGWSDEDIERGDRPMPSRLRAEFNRWLTSTVRKSIGRLAQ
jgi:bacterioferritin